MTRPMKNGNAIYAGPPDDPNRYQVGTTVGTGGEGEVARGLLLIDGEPVDVALKMWRHAGDASSLEARAEAWQSQVRLVRSITHPGIVRMREAFVGAPPHYHDQPARPGQVLYLVMNWAPGVPLSRWTAERPGLDHRELCAIVLAVSVALAHLHAGIDTGGRTVLHRDLKPDNIIIADVEHLQLVDFGLAGGTPGEPERRGTPGYVAPEVAAHGRFSTASDIYALGALAYFLVTGEHPPDQGGGDVDLGPVRAAPLTADHPAVVDHIGRAMATRPEDRPVDAVAWAQRLAYGRRRASGAADTPVFREPASPAPGRPDPIEAPAPAPVVEPAMPTVLPPSRPSPQAAPVGPSPEAAPMDPAPADRPIRTGRVLGLTVVGLVVLALALPRAGLGIASPAAPTSEPPPASTMPATTAVMETAPEPTPPPTTAPSTPVPPPVGTTAPRAPVTDPTTSPSTVPPPVSFLMPSKNIGCSLSGSGARCDINTKNWTAPPPGAGCGLEWGDAIQVATGPATFVCHSDNLIGSAAVLAYNRSARWGPYRCDSAEAGVTCRHEGTGHGFSLARERYDIF
jgi:serine/threonine protein kinase